MRALIAQINGLMKKLASLPAEDYPPANIAKMIKICKQKERPDLGKKIMDRWNIVVNKYPVARLNWGAAVKIGGASIKKNVFGRQEFSYWLEDQLDLSPQETREVRQQEVPEPRPSVPPIAIPRDDETAEDWKKAAAKTKNLLTQVNEAFTNTEDLIDFLQGEIKTLENKIEVYGPGGAKELTKDGKPSKFSKRVPKWDAQLKLYKQKLDETGGLVKEAKKKFKKAKDSYNEAPVTTVAYEGKAQDALEDTLSFIMKMKDPEKQKKMLADFQKLVSKMEKNSDKIRAASLDKEAAIWETLSKAFDSVVNFLKDGWKSLIDWAKGLNKKVDAFDNVATRVGR